MDSQQVFESGLRDERFDEGLRRLAPRSKLLALCFLSDLPLLAQRGVSERRVLCSQNEGSPGARSGGMQEGRAGESKVKSKAYQSDLIWGRN